MKDSVADLNDHIKKMVQTADFDKHVADLVETGAQEVSWNHGKIFAINGKRIYTGGVNWWNEYKTEQKNSQGERIDHNIMDHGIKLVEGAAVSGHRWADYFRR